MQEPSESYDPFNWTYFLATVGVMVAIPLLHVILGWFTFYL